MATEAELMEARQARLDSVIGLTWAQVADAALAGGFRYRLVNLEGSPLVGTRDYVPNRVNVTIKGGVVTESHSG